MHHSVSELEAASVSICRFNLDNHLSHLSSNCSSLSMTADDGFLLIIREPALLRIPLTQAEFKKIFRISNKMYRKLLNNDQISLSTLGREYFQPADTYHSFWDGLSIAIRLSFWESGCRDITEELLDNIAIVLDQEASTTCKLFQIEADVKAFTDQLNLELLKSNDKFYLPFDRSDFLRRVLDTISIFGLYCSNSITAQNQFVTLR